MSRERPRARLGSHAIFPRRCRTNDRHAHGTSSSHDLPHDMNGSQCGIQPVDQFFTILSNKRTWWCGGRFFQPFSAPSGLPRPMTNSTPTSGQNTAYTPMRIHRGRTKLTQLPRQFIESIETSPAVVERPDASPSRGHMALMRRTWSTMRGPRLPSWHTRPTFPKT
jgi:hypothetical protein